MAAEDFYLFFSGTQGNRIDTKTDTKFGGQPVPEGDVKQMGEFTGITDRAGVKLNRWAWFGSVIGDLAVRNAHKRLTDAREYVPGVSRLIIYGYSAGGKNALELCREFDKSNAGPAPPVVVTVDLLVTVDAAAWTKSDKIDRTLAKCVRRNLNYFQESEGFSGSHGAPNPGDRSAQRIDDFKRSEKHADINDAVMPEAKKVIQEVIDGASTEVPLAGVWDAAIGPWRGRFEFTPSGDASWQEADPQRLKSDPKKHTGVWWEESGEVHWQYADDPKAYKRTFVARRPLGRTVKGDVLPAGRGFYEMTKR